VADGQSQAEAAGQSLGFIASEKINAALADAGPIYPGVRFRRAVALFGDDLVLVVDQISGTAPHTYDLAYHNRGTFDVQPTGSRISMPSLPGYMHLQNTVTAEARGSFSTVFNLDGGLSTRFTTIVPSGGQIILGTGVGKNRSDRVPMVLLRVKTAEFVVGWALTIGKKDGAAPVLQLRRDTPGALEATLGERKCLLVSNPELRRIRLGKKAYNTPLICFEKQGEAITFEEAEPAKAAGTRR
jgi:hypothetical protein